MLRKMLMGCAMAAAVSLGSTSAHAGVFITTGHTGAQVQDDINHTQYWTYSLSANVNGVDGGLFTMKKGPSTVDDITFDIIQGTYADFGSVTPLMEVTLTPGDFTQSFNPVLFQGAAIDLLANTTYTAILWSNAVDTQSTAYFIKGASTPSFSDQNGNPVNTNVVVTDGGSSTVPEPASLGLLAVAAVAIARRRR